MYSPDWEALRSRERRRHQPQCLTRENKFPSAVHTNPDSAQQWRSVSSLPRCLSFTVKLLKVCLHLPMEPFPLAPCWFSSQSLFHLLPLLPNLTALSWFSFNPISVTKHNCLPLLNLQTRWPRAFLLVLFQPLDHFLSLLFLLFSLWYTKAPLQSFPKFLFTPSFVGDTTSFISTLHSGPNAQLPKGQTRLYIPLPPLRSDM